MKSLYYAALVTRSYRKAVDALEGKIASEEAAPYIDELYKTNHRNLLRDFFTHKRMQIKPQEGRQKATGNLLVQSAKLSVRKKARLFLQRQNKSQWLFKMNLRRCIPKQKKLG